MKKVIIVAGIVSMILSSCTNNKLATYSDDIYANPIEERAQKERLAAEKKKQQEELAKKEAEQRAAELAAQKAKDDANPLYKDPSYNKDDYYDYEYSSRLRRFNNPVNGVGYYDNYYTNNYFYSGNPYMYGNSIYSSYNYWGPNYSNYGCWPSSYFGVSVSYGYPNYGYGYGSPYGFNSNSYWQGYYNGYNNGYYNGYYGYPYGYSYGYPSYGYGCGYPYYGYGYGYNSPYCYNNGWGYFNAYDANSGYNKPLNAPRGSHDGGNTGRPTGPGKYTDGLVQKYVQEVQVAQATTPKFTGEGRSTKPKSNANNSNLENSGSIPVQTIYNAGNPTKPRRDLNEGNDVQYNSGTTTPKDINGNSNEPKFGGNSPAYTSPKNTINSGNNSEVEFNGGNNNPPKSTNYEAKPNKPVRTNSYENNPPKGNIFDSGSPSFNNGNNNNNSSPSNNSPRGGGNTGGGGGRRPR